MNEGLSFIKKFFNNQGHYILVSLLLGKICAFLSSLFIIKLIPESDFGEMSIVAALFAIFASCTGLGSYQSLLRFGSLLDSEILKKRLSSYLLARGFVYQIILTFIFLACSIFYIRKYENIFWIFFFFSIRFIGFYFFYFIQSEIRIRHKNREFAKLNNVVNLGGLFSLLILSYFFQMKGFLIAIALAPFLSLFWLKVSDFSMTDLPSLINSTEIWKYAIQTSGTAILSDALFSIDVLLLGFLLNENAVASYKVVLLIPSNITFLALAFMQSDFPRLAKNYNNKKFLKSYISGYYKLFIPICSLIFIIASIFSEFFLKFLFNEKYAENYLLFIFFMFVFLMNILFRNLYGNLLSAVGKMHVNTKISLFSLFLLIGLAAALVPKYDILGMTISVCITLLSSGFILAYFFHKYLKRLK